MPHSCRERNYSNLEIVLFSIFSGKYYSQKDIPRSLTLHLIANVGNNISIITLKLII